MTTHEKFISEILKRIEDEMMKPDDDIKKLNDD
jgi:hypothetical protein